MPQILFRNLNLLDPRWNEARGGYEVLVEGDTDQGSVSQADQGGQGARWSTAASAP